MQQHNHNTLLWAIIIIFFIFTILKSSFLSTLLYFLLIMLILIIILSYLDQSRNLLCVRSEPIRPKIDENHNLADANLAEIYLCWNTPALHFYLKHWSLSNQWRKALRLSRYFSYYLLSPHHHHFLHRFLWLLISSPFSRLLLKLIQT